MPYYHGPASYYLHIYRYASDGSLLLKYPSYYLGTIQWNGDMAVEYTLSFQQ